MKTILTLAITIASMTVVGCKDQTQKEKDLKYWHVITIDRCQYIESSRWDDVPLIHKANCNNPQHLQKSQHVFQKLIDTIPTEKAYLNLIKNP